MPRATRPRLARTRSRTTQANRLISATVGGGTSTYDGDGKRTSKTVDGVTTSYVYDVAGGLPMLLDDGARKYVWGAGGLAFTVDKGTAAVQVYHTDGLGSVRAITDSTGSVTQTYQTDEFGVLGVRPKSAWPRANSGRTPKSDGIGSGTRQR